MGQKESASSRVSGPFRGSGPKPGALLTTGNCRRLFLNKRQCPGCARPNWKQKYDVDFDLLENTSCNSSLISVIQVRPVSLPPPQRRTAERVHLHPHAQQDAKPVRCSSSCHGTISRKPLAVQIPRRPRWCCSTVQTVANARFNLLHVAIDLGHLSCA